MVGPPRGFDAKNHSLTKAAYDLHKIADEELETMGVDPDKAIAIGDSRGAMVGLGMAVDKYSYGRKVPYIDITAACAPRQFKLKEWPRVLAQLGVEAAHMSEFAIEYGKRGQIGRYLASILPADPAHGLNAIRTLPGLVNGDTGRLFDATAIETYIHCEEFTGDYWSQIEEWKARFTDRPNANLEIYAGSHISGIVKSQTRRRKLARLDVLSEARGFDGSFADLDINSLVTSAPPESPNLPKAA
jgi:hypothetical protein